MDRERKRGNRVVRVASEDLPPFAQFASAVPLLAGLERRDALAPAAEPFALADGDPLFVQNDLARGAYFVASGTLAVSARTPGDGDHAIAAVGPGGVVGELCLLDHGRRSAEVRAQGAVNGYRLDYERFSGLLAGGEPAAAALVARLHREVAARIADALAAIGGTENGSAIAPLPAGEQGDPAQLHRLLGPFPGYDRFRDDDWAALARIARRLEAPRGTDLATAGQPRERLLLVARGALRESLGGRQLIIHGPGRIANAAPVVAGGSWPTRLAVREEAAIYALDRGARLGPRLTELLGLQLTRDLRRLTRERNRAFDPALEAA